MSDPSQQIPILNTKLFQPQWLEGMISRQRLVERLTSGGSGKLTLISAPAGFGKTTLLAEWLDSTGADISIAWVSLDATDNDPKNFWLYVLHSINQVHPDIADNALALLLSPQAPPVEAVLTALLNEVSLLDKPLTLILDDYHIIENQPIHEAFTFLLDHLPEQLRVVIASRTDPALPLPRLRARGQLTEIRIADMRFTPDEAADFFSRSMGLSLTTNDIAVLENRTEGWIAGLKLAALSLQGREDVQQFIAAFSGDDRFIEDYLIEEVLQIQPEEVRRFLLYTSVLGRLSGPLCRAVSGIENSAALLESLERENLFLVHLDDKRQWYRYHHLFGDVLQSRLADRYPELLPQLHQRASEWFKENKLIEEAVRHALASEDLEYAADLIEHAWPALRRGYKEATFYEWLKNIPDELIRVRPGLSVVHAWALMDAGQLEAGAACLRNAERWLSIDEYGEPKNDPPGGEMVIANEGYFAKLPATIASARAYFSLAFNDIENTLRHTERALSLFPEDDYYERGAPAALHGLAHIATGNLDAGYNALKQAMWYLHEAESVQLGISGTFMLADIRIAQGRLNDAIQVYFDSLELVKASGDSLFPGVAELHIGLSELFMQQGRVSDSRRHQQRIEELGKRAMIPGNESRMFASEGRTRLLAADADEALRLLIKAQERYRRDPVPDACPIHAVKTRALLMQGKLEPCREWIHENGYDISDEIVYLTEFEYITFARVLLAEYRLEKQEESITNCMRLLERLLKSSREGGRAGRTIEVLMLQALVHEAQGEIQAAMEPIGAALEIGEPENYIRLFVNEGEPIRLLLKHAAARGLSVTYVRTLLDAFEETEEIEIPETPDVRPSTEVQLTNRELEILRLIATGLRNQEIADQLFISLHTVKRHIANTYTKLDASHRTEAIARAQMLKLI